MRSMELERRLREGELETTSSWNHQPGAFERYTKVRQYVVQKKHNTAHHYLHTSDIRDACFSKA